MGDKAKVSPIHKHHTIKVYRGSSTAVDIDKWSASRSDYLPSGTHWMIDCVRPQDLSVYAYNPYSCRELSPSSLAQDFIN
jgi:hypothetical protein